MSSLCICAWSAWCFLFWTFYWTSRRILCFTMIVQLTWTWQYWCSCDEEKQQHKKCQGYLIRPFCCHRNWKSISKKIFRNHIEGGCDGTGLITPHVTTLLYIHLTTKHYKMRWEIRKLSKQIQRLSNKSVLTAVKTHLWAYVMLFLVSFEPQEGKCRGKDQRDH